MFPKSPLHFHQSPSPSHTRYKRQDKTNRVKEFRMDDSVDTPARSPPQAEDSPDHLRPGRRRHRHRGIRGPLRATVPTGSEARPARRSEEVDTDLDVIEMRPLEDDA